MGVINITPDSFSDGGRFLDSRRAVEEAQRQLKLGADAVSYTHLTLPTSVIV